MLFIIVGILLVIIILIIVISVNKSKFKFLIIKLDEAENNIKLYLNKKFKLIKNCRDIVKKELKIKNLLAELDNIKPEDLNNFEFHNILSDNYNKLFTTIDDNEKLYKSDDLNKLVDEINDNEDYLYGCIKYYNDVVVEFNRLLITFPSNIIKAFFGYKKKEFYKKEKREVFEILKDDKK